MMNSWAMGHALRTFKAAYLAGRKVRAGGPELGLPSRPTLATWSGTSVGTRSGGSLVGSVESSG
jgi:hypothetical protein